VVTASKLTAIPYENIYLVYSGKIWDKNKTIGDYCIQSNAYIYVVDSRKHMKKVSKEEYSNRVR
jgi:hypothetical protein